MNILYLKLNESIPDGFTGLTVSVLDTKTWYKNGIKHRTDGPAVIWQDGTKIWFIEGVKHRIDGPAIEFSDGIRHWYLNGEMYIPEILECLIEEAYFLGKEKGKYNLEWLKFMKEDKLEEFPLIPGMLDHLVFSDTKLYEKIKDLNDNKT